MATLSYAQAGVDREAADRLVGRIAGLAKKTLNSKVKSAVGGYASLYEIDKNRYLAASTDGVGTKLKLAFELQSHRTVGIDLVAMSVNDLLCVGAEPLFFLDYLATGKLDEGVAEQVLEGIVEGCKLAGCALVGGETAEMPDFYQPGEYDLAGFSVGMVQKSRVLPKREVRVGDRLIGMASSGFHSNGYSLLRKLLAQEWDSTGLSEASRGARARELLTPTRIYAKSLLPLIESKSIKGLAHITGSGFLNVPRISEKVSYQIELPEPTLSVFEWVREASGLPLSELAQTFNLGIGMVLAVDARLEKKVLSQLKRRGEKAMSIGKVVRREKGKPSQVHLTYAGEQVVLNY